MQLEPIQPQADTPLLKQYWEIKNQYQDAILLFRLGDFYEMFFNDAVVASKILDIALTSRDKNAANPVPLCGVPYHSIAGYISKLLEKGHKVAICEQVEDPAVAKGIVRREVVRVVTPGLQTELEGLEASQNNPLVSIVASKQEISIAWIEVGSGEFQISHFQNFEQFENEVWKLSPKEIVIPEGNLDGVLMAWVVAYSAIRKSVRFERLASWIYEQAEKKLCERFSVSSLQGFGLGEYRSQIEAAGALLYYIESQNRTPIPHLHAPKTYSLNEFVQLDRSTREHLEIDRVKGEPGSDRTLFYSLNETATSIGARKLRSWLHMPLRNQTEIQTRLDSVEELVENTELRELLRTELNHVYDLERLIGRIASARANGRDLVALRSTLVRMASIKSKLQESKSVLLQNLHREMNPHKSLQETLTKAFVDNPPLGINEGGMFLENFSPELDELKKLTSGGKQWIAELEATERSRTSIGSLKVAYNRVFGYYIEVSKTNLSKVPNDYIRKQTLANAERFVTPDLKIQEEKILSAQEKISALEFSLFEQIRNEIVAHTRSLQSTSNALAQIDVLCSLARISSRYRYTRPILKEGSELKITEGRHPVVERFMDGEPFVANSIQMDTETNQIIILTGPNMAGKSTIMRQMALIVLLAQIGCFVPADYAEIGIVDQIFTRVGASDDLAGGRSTFMVEMNETANILRNATPKSLILLDEIGRGTSTFDGLAIAWSVAEYIHDKIGAKTIFATHYHELTDLSRIKPRVKNMNVQVKEWGDKIVFLRSLAEGAVNRSYGIEVARLAGVPMDVISRAREILLNLENGELDSLGAPKLATNIKSSPQAAQFDLFHRLGDELLQELSKSSIDDLSPKEALELLYRWKERYRVS